MTPANRIQLQWTVFISIALLVMALVAWLATDLGERKSYETLQNQANSSATLNTALLRSELEKQRSLPFVLAEDPDVRAALTTRDSARLGALDEKLEMLKAGTRAAVIYLLDEHGTAIAGSNWRSSASPIGNDYRFRSYFQQAWSEGAAEYFALGTRTRRPGLYISRRIPDRAGPLGVVVVKVQFDQIEWEWSRSGAHVFVTDPQGIVIIAGNPAWHFMRALPLQPRDTEAIRASRQFGDAPLDPLPIQRASRNPSESNLVMLQGHGRFVAASAAVPSTDWTMHVLLPAQPALSIAQSNARSTALLALIPVAMLAGLLLYRRQRAREQEARGAAARAELEVRVNARTMELRLMNQQLSAEMEERQKAEAELQTTREELIQANRLAVLGQITAGVAHEINQPVAAIRSYADNAVLLLRRGDSGGVDRNLSTIAALTDQVGGITQELRAFARKGSGEIGPTCLRDVIDGALLMLRARIREQGVDVTVERPPEAQRALGKLLRLQQVLVNLVQNALDALAGQPQPAIRIAAHVDGEFALLTVEDNGPGIPAEIQKRLFAPFTTSKPRGLGLGLVISKDLVAECGGRLELTRSGEQGTSFTIQLRRVF